MTELDDLQVKQNLMMTMEWTMGSFWLMGLMPLKFLSVNVTGERFLNDYMSTQLMSIYLVAWR